MPTLDATAGDADANSYATLAEASTYFDERLQASNWTGESDEDVKERALIMATRRIDALRFTGVANTDTQALEWPRFEAFDLNGYEYDTASIPDPVKRATYEEALRILNDNAASTDPLADSELAQFNRAKVGAIEVDINHDHKPTELAPAARREIAHVLKSSGHMATLERA